MHGSPRSPAGSLSSTPPGDRLTWRRPVDLATRRAAAAGLRTSVVASGLVAEAVAALLREQGVDASVAAGVGAGAGPAVWLLVADGRDVAAAVRCLRAASPCARVVLLVGEADAATVVHARRAGVDGVVDARASGRELAAAVARVAAGLRVAPALTRATGAGAGPVLSARQRDVLRLVAAGRSNREIAWELTITINTVKFHVRTIFRELGIHSRVEAARLWSAAEARERLI